MDKDRSENRSLLSIPDILLKLDTGNLFMKKIKFILYVLAVPNEKILCKKKQMALMPFDKRKKRSDPDEPKLTGIFS
jgi:hypothetical protein